MRFALVVPALFAALNLQAQAPAQAPAGPTARPRQQVPMDSARAAALYVSNRHADHPTANYAQAIAGKARTDSIFEATQKGYVVVAPDYRGSTGYGEAHHNAIDYGGKELDDVEDAHDFLLKRSEVDPSRIGLMGWSHGGFITALLMMRGERAKFVAGAAIVPVTNLILRLSYKGPRYQRSFSTQRELSGLPFEQRAEYVKRSPYYHVDSLSRPLLVHIASNDEDVNFEEARPLVDALVARKPHLAETRIYWDPTPGPSSVGHTFSRRVNRTTLLKEDSPEQIDSWNRVWNFFEWNIKPAVGATR